MYWVVECQNFIAETIVMIANFSIITYFSHLPYDTYINYFFATFILVVYKYSHNINERRLFLALKNFQEWENISEKIIPNIFIVQSFDYRTHKMSVYDCNQRAKKYDIHQSQEKYVEFLNQLQIEDFLSLNKITECSLKNLGSHAPTLKDYLLKKHEEIYRTFIKSNAHNRNKFKSMKVKSLKESKQSHKKSSDSLKLTDQNKSRIDMSKTNIETNKSTPQIENSQDYVDNISVTMFNKEKKKRITFKVKIFTLLMNEPFLVICLEDISVFSKIKDLKEQQHDQLGLVQSLIKCLQDKIHNFKTVNQGSIKQLQRNIIYMKYILKSFQSRMKPIDIRSFNFNDVIDSIKALYNDYTINFKGDYSNIQISSDQNFVFTTLIAIISSLNMDSIKTIDINQVKDKFCEKVVLTFLAKNIGQVNLSNFQLNNLFELQNHSKVYGTCFNYIKSIMKQICMQDQPKVELKSKDSISIEIEYVLNVNDLNISNQQTQQLILSPSTLSKKLVIFSSQSLIKSNYQNISVNTSIFKQNHKLSQLLKSKEQKEIDNHQSIEDPFKFDSFHSSTFSAKSNPENSEIFNPIRKTTANVVYDFSFIKNFSNPHTSFKIP